MARRWLNCLSRNGRARQLHVTRLDYPFWSLMIIAIDIVALWGLCMYGSRENIGAVS